MKPIILVLVTLLVAVAGVVQAQSNDKGFIAISAGASIPMGDYSNPSGGYAKTGVQVNVITFGRKLTDNLGVALNWYGAANSFGNDDGTWGYGGLALGPLIAFPVENVEFDFRPMVGLSDALYIPSGSGQSSTVFAFGLDLGASVRFNVSRKIGIIVNADYTSTKPNFSSDNGSFEQQISAVGVTAGIAFRLGAK